MNKLKNITFALLIVVSPSLYAQNDTLNAEIKRPALSSAAQETIQIWAKLEAAGFVNVGLPPFPKFYFDMRYATPNNLAKTALYDSEKCYLQKDAAEKLVKAFNIAQKHSPRLTFIIYDCYRPTSAHNKLWAAFPNASYVAPPKKGSRHSRGMAVDLGLALEDGTPLQMPTDFDSLSKLAHMDYDGDKVSEEAKTNREILKNIMTQAGFTYTRTEWWHYDCPGWEKYPLQDIAVK